jgi:hypothetical protein
MTHSMPGVGDTVWRDGKKFIVMNNEEHGFGMVPHPDVKDPEILKDYRQFRPGWPGGDPYHGVAPTGRVHYWPSVPR